MTKAATMTKAKGKQAAEQGVGVGIAAAGVAAALGYYFYASEDAKQHRREAAKWAEDMKKEVVKEVKMVKKVSPVILGNIVDRAALVYRDIKGVDEKELERVVAELKKNWSKVATEAKKITT